MRRRDPRRGGRAPHSSGAGPSDPRRDQQLGRQAERALTLALADLDDPLLEELALLDVQARHGALTVQLLAPSGCDPETLGRIRARLEAVRGRLRSELAAALRRRRVPELVLRVAVPFTPGGAP